MVGGVVVRSTATPWSFITRIWFWVPVTSPPNAPTTSQALLAWKAGVMLTSGERRAPLTVTRSLSPAFARRVEGKAVIPVVPSATE